MIHGAGGFSKPLCLQKNYQKKGKLVETFPQLLAVLQRKQSLTLASVKGLPPPGGAVWPVLGQAGQEALLLPRVEGLG